MKLSLIHDSTAERDLPPQNEKVFSDHVHQQRYFLTIPQKYQRMFKMRGVTLDFTRDPTRGRQLYSEHSRHEIIPDAQYCFWAFSEDDAVIEEIDLRSGYLWHIGLDREQSTNLKEKLILIPRADLFEIRYIPQSSKHYRIYRTAISLAWREKASQVYFLGHNTGIAHQSRVRACLALLDAGIPANVGLLPKFLPKNSELVKLVKQPEPVYALSRYKYVLSLWGNHPFNPRLFRGLESGSLVFHQETPDVVQLHDGLLKPYEHYVPIRPDLSDLLEKIEYYMQHETEGQEIAESGKQRWREMLYIENPYELPDVIWQRFIAQPSWQSFASHFDQSMSSV